eukprot:gene5271-2413_t
MSMSIGSLSHENTARFISLDEVNADNIDACLAGEEVLGQNIRWKKGKVLGRGAFGNVYLGLNAGTGEMLAVKETKHEHWKESYEALQQEIDLLQKLKHEHIVSFFGTDEIDNGFVVYLEFVPGGSLAHMIKEFGKLGEGPIQHYVQQMLLGLSYLHEMGIVHQDIKGGNVLVNDRGEVKLADFGCSKRMESFCTDGETSNGEYKIQGTPLWMDPAVIR